MPDIDIGDAAMAGWRLIGRHPLSVVTWGLAMAALFALMVALFGGTIIAAVTALAASTAANAAGATGAAAAPPYQLIFGLIGSLFGFIVLLAVCGQLLDLAIRAAVLRAELEPGHGAFAYLRFGSQELWLIATSLVFWFLLFAANIAMSIPLAIVSMAGAAGAVLSSAQGGAGANVGAMTGLVGIRLAGQLFIIAVSIWLWLKLCFGVVLTYRERQFRLFESWSATRGHVLKMFLTLLLVVLMLFVVFIVMGVVCLFVAGGIVAAVAGGNWQALAQKPPAMIAAALWPLGLVALVMVAINAALGNTLIWGAVARMWQQLNPDADAPGAFT